MQGKDSKRCAMGLALALTIASAPTLASDTPEAAARALVEAVEAAHPDADALDAWRRAVLDRALGRAGALPPAGDTTPTAAPLPAEREAATLARSLGHQAAGPEVLVFVSLILPEASWRRWSLDAARAGAALVLRGVAPNGLAATVRRLRARLPEGGAGVAVDPVLFRRFAVDAVPASATNCIQPVDLTTF